MNGLISVNMKSWLLITVDANSLKRPADIISKYPGVTKVIPVRGIWDFIVEMHLTDKTLNTKYLIQNESFIKSSLYLSELE